MGPNALDSGAGSREQRRTRIEQVALELFRTRGFDQVTVEDVCAAAGVAPATFYRYFGTKEEVVFAYQEGFTAAMRGVIGQMGDREKSLASGATDYVTKPVDLDELLAIMASWVTGNDDATARYDGARA